jgi:hypothetical protein
MKLLKWLKKEDVEPETKTEARGLVKDALTHYPQQQELMAEKILGVMDEIKDNNVHPVVALYAIKGMEYLVADALKRLLQQSRADDAPDENIELIYQYMIETLDEVSMTAYGAIMRGDVPKEIEDKAAEIASKHDCNKCKEKKEDLFYIN